MPRSKIIKKSLYTQSTELFNLNFQSLEVVSRYRDPRLQVTENYVICEILVPIYISVSRLKSYFTVNSSLSGVIFYCEQLVIRGYTGANKNAECLLQSTSVF